MRSRWRQAAHTIGPNDPTNPQLEAALDIEMVRYGSVPNCIDRRIVKPLHANNPIRLSVLTSVPPTLPMLPSHRSDCNRQSVGNGLVLARGWPGLALPICQPLLQHSHRPASRLHVCSSMRASLLG